MTWGWASFLNLRFVLSKGHMLVAYQMDPSNRLLNSSIHQWHLLCQFSEPCVFSKGLTGPFTPFKQVLVWQLNSLTQKHLDSVLQNKGCLVLPVPQDGNTMF